MYTCLYTLAGHQGYPFNFAKTIVPGEYSGCNFPPC